MAARLRARSVVATKRRGNKKKSLTRGHRQEAEPPPPIWRGGEPLARERGRQLRRRPTLGRHSWAESAVAAAWRSGPSKRANRSHAYACAMWDRTTRASRSPNVQWLPRARHLLDARG